MLDFSAMTPGMYPSLFALSGERHASFVSYEYDIILHTTLYRNFTQDLIISLQFFTSSIEERSFPTTNVQFEAISRISGIKCLIEFGAGYAGERTFACGVSQVADKLLHAIGWDC